MASQARGVSAPALAHHATWAQGDMSSQSQRCPATLPTSWFLVQYLQFLFLLSFCTVTPQILPKFAHIYQPPPPRSYCIFQSFSLLLLLKSQQPVSINYFLPSSQLPTIRITCSPCSKRCSLEVTEVLSSLRSRTFQLF